MGIPDLCEEPADAELAVGASRFSLEQAVAETVCQLEAAAYLMGGSLSSTESW